ncbi:ATP-binding protein [Tamlana sp. 2_MG-2023]|uniref:ATP-binding protein n=1 Tax=unclassified Tamlana TaxID=2614803 RepID=UPI0026E3D550|nr:MULTISPECIES: ATP-binding protein [unclassified Tamlana]MDO6760384.1 ATP-binding protein [Tamlana sp. 2_MG-2023]MDO6789917.1 ATP-binding protein [Tamlana sp. 1_MG-2023]
MDFKRVYTSTKTYIILLIAALALLLFIASMAYKQIMRMQESAETVAKTLHVYNAIGGLTEHYTRADSEEFRSELLEDVYLSHALKNYKIEGKAVLDSLKVLTLDNDLQQARLEPLESLLLKMNNQLHVLDTLNIENDQEFFETKEAQKNKIDKTIASIRILKNQMLANEKYLMQERQANYASYKFLAPVTSLFLAFLALFICVLSFLRVYKNKLRLKQSEAFLRNILATTDNIINYFEPVFDANEAIVDFKVIYANDCNRDYLGLDPDVITGQLVSETFPFLMADGEFIGLTNAYNDQSKVDFEKEVVVGDKKMWFNCLATSLTEGVLLTARNITLEKESNAAQQVFKKRLENQNLELLDSRAFLGNIFKSISHIVMHFKSIRDENGKIVDFEILFANERISPVTGDLPQDLKHKKISEAYPEMIEIGVLDKWVNAVENNTPVQYEVPYYNNNKKHWFSSTAIKLGDGVTLTARDVTEEKKKSDELIKLNEDLTIQNSILSDAESLAKIGSFVWDMESDTSELSDNFYAMLGCEPNEFKSSLLRYKDFVHPDDLELYEKRGASILDDSETAEHTYRIVTKQGKVKHFKSNGQFVTKNARKVMIGVVQDVTESIEAEERLVKSNLRLKQSNAELESFNRVASHDLQEPLRKIQLFISRIEDREGEQFSDKGKLYFEKVTNGVKRMQSLIKNLLAYSRIDSSKTDFEKIDLNDILLKTEDDLATRINDSGAEVLADKLPKIKGVVFQMEQLFANLISNALKYKNLNERPQVEIRYKRVSATKLPGQFVTIKKRYHKLTFKDNGIGFDSQYAEKIFEVFQRLHQKNEYSGNGIGLAICKKIVENHNGYIYAKGNPGKGAEFIVYLPA